MSSPREKKSLLRSIAVLRRDKKTELALNLIGFESTAPIYVNEHLTKHNYTILKAAIDLKKQKKLHAVFTRHGICHVKCKSKDNAISINCLQELTTLSRSLTAQPRNVATDNTLKSDATHGFRDGVATDN